MRVLPLRPILFALAAFAAVLIYLIWWVSYAGIHYIPRYSLRPPGASGEGSGDLRTPTVDDPVRPAGPCRGRPAGHP